MHPVWIMQKLNRLLLVTDHYSQQILIFMVLFLDAYKSCILFGHNLTCYLQITFESMELTICLLTYTQTSCWKLKAYRISFGTLMIKHSIIDFLASAESNFPNYMIFTVYSANHLKLNMKFMLNMHNTKKATSSQKPTHLSLSYQHGGYHITTGCDAVTQILVVHSNCEQFFRTLTQNISI